MSSRLESLRSEPPSSERKLSKTEIDTNAFDLMGGFRIALLSSPQFREGLVESYLELGSDEGIKDKPYIRVNFHIDKDEYTAEYKFSKKEQELLIIKSSSYEEEKGEKIRVIDVKTEVIILRSRRFEDQKPIRSPLIQYHDPLTWDTINQQHLYKNNSFALQKAREMLAGLSSQK